MFFRGSWEVIRQKGKSGYLWYRTKVGFILALFVPLVKEFADTGGLHWDRLTQPAFLLSFATALLGFPLVFYLMGLVIWNRNEKWYQQDREQKDRLG